MSQCESYLRLARDGVAQQTDVVPDNIDVDSLISDGDDDKVYGAMGVAKTIGTVGLFLVLQVSCIIPLGQVVSSIESSPDTLKQVQEVIIPIIRYTLESKLLGMVPLLQRRCFFSHSLCRSV